MHFTDDQAEDVKKWVVKKLENISDADSDVLGDYVLALIRTDADDDEIKRTSVENLEDFLKENTVPFVDEIFSTFSPKPQVPPPALQSAPVQLPIPTSSGIINAPTGPSNTFGNYPNQGRNGNANFDGFNQSHKRSFNEHHAGAGDDSQLGQRDRSFKTPRTRRGGRGDRMGARDGRPQPNMPGFPAPNASLPSMPQMPAGFPAFDPNDPMSAFLAMQAMGFPQLPGMPPFPGQGNQSGPAGSDGSRNGRKQRCIKYDTEGFCILGTSCPYEHGNDRITAPSKEDEYDPADANMMMDIQSSANGQPVSGRGRGNDRGRGRGRGRGGREGFTPRKNRADFSAAGPNEDRNIKTIVVEQIPEDKFSEEAVREFFSQFGNIVNVTLQAYKHLALVEFDGYDSARQAWESPKVIFDNRFVKVYWYKPNAPGRQERSGSAHGPPETNEPAFDKEEFERQQAEAQRNHEEKMKKRREAEENRQALEKQRNELMKKQAEEKAKLMERLGQKQPEETEMDTKADGGSSSDKKESEQTKALKAQLAALEAEAKSLGIDPAAADSSYRGRGRGYRGGRGGAFVPRGGGRGSFDPSARGGYGFRARGGAPPRGRGGVLRLDNRPRRVAVSGTSFDPQKDEALRQYLLGVGDVDTIDPNPDRSDSQIVAFKTRYVAEQLMYGPSEIPGVGKVEFSWVANLPSTAGSSSAPATTPVPSTNRDDDGDGPMDAEQSHGNESDHFGDSKGNGVDAGMDYDVADDEDRWGVGI